MILFQRLQRPFFCPIAVAPAPADVADDDVAAAVAAAGRWPDIPRLYEPWEY